MPYPLGEVGSQRFRFEQYFPLLKEQGITFVTHSFWSQKIWSVLYKKGFFVKKTIGFISGFFRTIAILPSLKRYNFVFIHREIIPLGPPCIEWIMARVFGKKIIYDFDDAIWLPNTSKENRFISKIKWHGKVKQICRWSYRISCGNEFLATFARSYNKSVVVNPSTIDTTYHHAPSEYPSQKDQAPITLGWTGTHSTLHYLKTLEPVFQAIENKFSGRVQLLIIADKPPSLAVKSLRFLPWSKHSEINDLLKIDIGIMPLTDDIWAQGKCGFKILQYMSLGIPSIASPVGVNTKIIDQGVNGYLCQSPGEWIQTIESLIESKGLRVKIGQAAREKVISDYSILSNAAVFLSLFE
jgi:glycosyltransferase involved in cell wall biosynthesis